MSGLTQIIRKIKAVVGAKGKGKREKLSKSIGFNLLLWLLILDSLTIHNPVQAQVMEDNTLPTEVQTDNNRDFTVNAGEQRGNNLFHSFNQFSIPNNGSVSFNNAATIQNIFSRVTGNSVSQINGLIQANGSANLFLINPNGIIFGENASLNLGGSFMATTAESLVFQDGREFSTQATNSESLLTVSVPLGLQFGSNPGAIVNQANYQISDSFDLTNSNLTNLGLATIPEKTLALVGGKITVDGGAIHAPAGNIELGSVGKNSFVGLNPTSQGWEINYGNVNQFQDIKLDNLALVDASGTGAGDIQVWGKNIQILNGSAIASNTEGNVNGGKIKVQASDLLTIKGSDRTGTRLDPLLADIEIFFPFASQISSTTFGAGKAGDIEIITQDLKLIDGGAIELQTYPDSTGQGGDLFISASESIELQGNRPLLGVGENASNLVLPSVGLNFAVEINQASEISTSSISSGDGGNINLTSKNLRLTDGAIIATSPFSTGNAGDINLQVSQTIEILGISSKTRMSNSTITANTFAEGDAGNIFIDTGNLILRDQGSLGLRGTTSGSPGNLQVNANNIELSNGAGIIATNFSSGQGGNINLQILDKLTLKENSLISTQASDTANGGNINIKAKFVIAFPNQNSDILANAVAGKGGKIDIMAQGIFGLAEGNSQPPNLTNDIDASSEFGTQGIVELVFPQFTTFDGQYTISSNFVNVNYLFRNNFCKLSRNSRYLVTGRGGIPLTPDDDLLSEPTWSDWRIIAQEAQSEAVEPVEKTRKVNQIEMIQGWVTDRQGRVRLTANPLVVTPHQPQVNTSQCQ
jgi:filamentous hemagglutinin family protein